MALDSMVGHVERLLLRQSDCSSAGPIWVRFEEEILEHQNAPNAAPVEGASHRGPQCLDRFMEAGRRDTLSPSVYTRCVAAHMTRANSRYLFNC